MIKMFQSERSDLPWTVSIEFPRQDVSEEASYQSWEDALESIRAFLSEELKV